MVYVSLDEVGGATATAGIGGGLNDNGWCRFLDGCQGIGKITAVLWRLPPEAQLRSSSLKMRLKHDVCVRSRSPPRGRLVQPGVPLLLVGSMRGKCVVLCVGLRDLWVVCHLQVALSWLLATGPLPLPVEGCFNWSSL